MVWSHDDRWMVTGDHSGRIKYWQSNMNNVKEFVGHKDPVRDISYVLCAQSCDIHRRLGMIMSRASLLVVSLLHERV
jgi:WD40 repeat protein